MSHTGRMWPPADFVGARWWLGAARRLYPPTFRAQGMLSCCTRHLRGWALVLAACCCSHHTQVAFGLPEAAFAANPDGFRVVIHPPDFVFTACHEGMNRSQVRV